MMTLDGFMAGPKGELDWHVVDQDFMRYVAGMQETTDGLVFGRVTYEMMAAHWPTSNQPEAPMMNDLPKLVFSRTLKSVAWKNSRLATGDVREEIARLKAEPGKEIALIGSSDLASSLIREGLIDEYRIFVNPVVLGAGLPLFKDVARAPLTLVSSRAFDSGNVLLCYRPGR